MKCRIEKVSGGLFMVVNDQGERLDLINAEYWWSNRSAYFTNGDCFGSKKVCLAGIKLQKMARNFVKISRAEKGK